MIRGEVYRINLRRGRGHEQRGRRFGVVVQADALLGLSTVLLAPTCTSAAAASFRPEIKLDGQVTRVLIGQLRAVDLDRLGECAGRLSASEQARSMRRSSSSSAYERGRAVQRSTMSET